MMLINNRDFFFFFGVYSLIRLLFIVSIRGVFSYDGHLSVAIILDDNDF